QAETLNSAKEILPIILDLIPITSVVDVGCGFGAWLSVFKDSGIEDYLGLDGDYIDKNNLLISPDNFIKQNFNYEFNLNRRFDLAISLEVAEHLPAEISKQFISNLTKHSNMVLFSAAIPDQGGSYHINEQWLEYWIAIFKEFSFLPVDCIRKKIWNNSNVSWWYRQNLLLFVYKKVLKDHKRLLDEYNNQDNVYSIVHPELYMFKTNVIIQLLKLIQAQKNG
ncbi:MAG: methyltransferase domain-containing protein, partial [Cyanobacteriota bacterium]